MENVAGTNSFWMSRMIDSKQLIEYAKHPELALQSLDLLLTLLESKLAAKAPKNAA